MQQLIVRIIAILSTPLFYDIPEYLEIVLGNSFWHVFYLGHFPIHPVFLGILWIFIRLIPVNAIAIVFGIISIFVFYKISKLIFTRDNCLLPTLVFSLLPAVYLVNTNLMVESVALTFYLISIYAFVSKKKILFFVSSFLMIGVHLQSVVWLFSVFLFPFIFNINFKKKDLLIFVKYTFLAVFASFIFYILLYKVSGRAIEGQTEQLSVYFSSGILRMVRNSWLSFIRNFGSLTPFVLIYLFFRKVKLKNEKIGLSLLFILTAVVGANWQGDFMGRRIIFAAVFIALLIYKYLAKKTFYFILYLLPIVLANLLLYLGGSPFVLKNIPPNEILIETHYLHPFSKYDGTILWLGSDDLSVVDDYLDSGKRVFLTKQAITTPYRLLVGNNYHITSLARVGESESRFLFEKYVVEPAGSVLEIKLFDDKEKISSEAGEPIFFYKNGFDGRVERRRIDYGDIGTWVWFLIMNKRDTAGWTYKDARGIWYNIES